MFSTNRLESWVSNSMFSAFFDRKSPDFDKNEVENCVL